MELRKRSILTVSAIAIAAVLTGALLLGGVVPNATDKLGEELGAKGYVVVSIVRDGTEIYHYEDHNTSTLTWNDNTNYLWEIEFAKCQAHQPLNTAPQMQAGAFQLRQTAVQLLPPK